MNKLKKNVYKCIVCASSALFAAGAEASRAPTSSSLTSVWLAGDAGTPKSSKKRINKDRGPFRSSERPMMTRSATRRATLNSSESCMTSSTSSSVWFAPDAGTSESSKERHGDRAYLGVFTDDPAVIGKWLPRPLTPFCLPPDSYLGLPNMNETATLRNETEALDADDKGALFDFNSPKLKGTNYGLQVF
ncbi:MAG: hypothetical protein LBR89_04660 [Holosporales bacterium]|nr:hypothetical protein [Holosporales bacterium]